MWWSIFGTSHYWMDTDADIEKVGKKVAAVSSSAKV